VRLNGQVAVVKQQREWQEAEEMVGKVKRAKLMSSCGIVNCKGWEGSTKLAVDAFVTFLNVNGVMLGLLKGEKHR